VRGVRIQNIVNELYGEKIDVIEWSPDTAQFISNALSPAKPSNVTLDEVNHVATVIVPSEQMSLAIGKEGQNARLAHKLTTWRIDIKDPASLMEAGVDVIRQARAAVDAAPNDLGMWQGRQPRLVNSEGMIDVRGRLYGPLDPSLIKMSVDVDIIGDAIEVLYNRELRARFDVESGGALPLDDDAAFAPASAGSN
jgi:N utilization substance protein A